MKSSFLSSVIVFPLMAEMVRRSACLGSKSVDARTISSPTRQPAAFRTSIELLPASAVLASLVQVFCRSPCRFRVPPMSMIPRSTLSVVPPTPLISSSLTLFVKVIVALRVWGDFSVPISNSPCNMIHSVVSSTSLLFAKLSLPLIVKPRSGGVLTSRTTSMPWLMVTRAPSAGTFLSAQVAESDQRPPLTAEELDC